MTRLLGLLLLIGLAYFAIRQWSRRMTRMGLGKLESEQLAALAARAKSSRALRGALRSRERLHDRLAERGSEVASELAQEIDDALALAAGDREPEPDALSDLADSIADLEKAVRREADPTPARARLQAAAKRLGAR